MWYRCISQPCGALAEGACFMNALPEYVCITVVYNVKSDKSFTSLATVTATPNTEMKVLSTSCNLVAEAN